MLSGISTRFIVCSSEHTQGHVYVRMCVSVPPCTQNIVNGYEHTSAPRLTIVNDFQSVEGADPAKSYQKLWWARRTIRSYDTDATRLSKSFRRRKNNDSAHSLICNARAQSQVGATLTYSTLHSMGAMLCRAVFLKGLAQLRKGM